jgi:M6 family metalloprotease-like protein
MVLMWWKAELRQKPTNCNGLSNSSCIGRRDGRGHLIAGIETVAEYDIPAVMAHEFTHSMWIPDHYVYGKDGYGVGSEVSVWTNMDSGSWLDPPVDIDGWSKYPPRMG